MSVLTWMLFYRLNPDGVSYLKIAQNYANGDIKHAINGYWSPLISWILIPAYWLPIDPLAAFRALNATLALLPVATLAFLSRHARMHRAKRIALFFYLSSLGIILSLWATSEITPDLLSAIITSGSLFIVSRYIKQPTMKMTLLTGLSLALLYFAKSAGLYPALAIIGYLWYRALRIGKVSRDIINSLAVISVLFVALAGSWALLLSLKYNTPTVSTASTYTFSLIGPTHPTHPQLLSGVLRAHNSTDSSAWDDPSYLTLEPWNPLQHKKYYVNYIVKNSFAVIHALFSLTPLLIVAGYIAWNSRHKNKDFLVLFTLVSAITLTMYTLVFVEARYLWAVALPLLLIGGVSLTKARRVSVSLAAILGGVLLYSLLSLAPVIQKASMEQPAFSETYQLSKVIDSMLPQHAKVGSDTFVFGICYYARVQCAGIYTPATDSAAFQKMKSDGIEYYIDFEDKNLPVSSAYRVTRPGSDCYDFTTGKIIVCGKQTASIYKISH